MIGLLQSPLVWGTESFPNRCVPIIKKTTDGLSYTQIETHPGRQLYLFFSAHLDPSMQKDLQDLLGQTKRSPEKIKEQVQKILSSHKSILESKKNELRALDDLTGKEKIAWLGVEQAEADVAPFRTHLILQKLTLEKQLAEAGLRRSEIADITLLLYDSVQFWVSQVPDRIKLYQWVGIEDAFRHEEALKSADKIERLKTALQEYDRLITKLDPKSVKDLEIEIAQILGERRRTPAESESKLIQRFPSSETQGLAQEQLSAARQLIEASEQRDSAIATQITGRALPGSGIVTMGSAHAESLALKIQSACLKAK